MVIIKVTWFWLLDWKFCWNKELCIYKLTLFVIRFYTHKHIRFFKFFAKFLLQAGPLNLTIDIALFYLWK